MAWESRTRRQLPWGVGGGAIYGLGIRTLLQGELGHTPNVMSLAFVAGVPFAVGFLCSYIAELQEPQAIAIWITLPWVAILAGALGSAVALLEGAICIVMFFPFAIVVSSMGGIAGGLVGRYRRSRQIGNISTALVLLFPFLLSPVEGRMFSRNDLTTVENVIVINAPPSAVWAEIKTVAPIRRDELIPSWSRAIGFPDPVAATLSFEGIGGVRHASFTGVVMFIETVDVWEPGKRLAFSIRSLTSDIPPPTLDKHVTVGGPYFDVLRGEYVIEALP